MDVVVDPSFFLAVFVFDGVWRFGGGVVFLGTTGRAMKLDDVGDADEFQAVADEPQGASDSK